MVVGSPRLKRVRKVQCILLKKESPGLESPPFPGPLGQRIFETVSAEAWQRWVERQTMIINEYRLSTLDPQARAFLRSEMSNFFFGTGSAPPPGFQPQKGAHGHDPENGH
jgi:Fe-S cluster biosynthesis and repair protein YggX